MADGLIHPDAREWLARHGIPVDDDGIPHHEPLPGPPQTCSLCGQLAESPSRSDVFQGSGEHWELVVCRECQKLGYTDNAEYWRRVHKATEVE